MIECTIEPAVHTDHKLISLVFEIDQFKRGKGTWKLNNDFMLDSKYCEEIIQLLKNIESKYPMLDPKELWEMIKIECSEYSRYHGKEKATKFKGEWDKPLEVKGILENELDRNPEDNQLIDRLRKVKQNLDTMAQKKVMLAYSDPDALGQKKVRKILNFSLA